MDEHPPTDPSQLPPPFDWTRLAPAADPYRTNDLPRPAQMPGAAQMPTSPPVAPLAAPPVGPPHFGAPPPPAANPPSPRSTGGGGRRRHPAHRARVAAAIVSGAAFVGLVGCTALTATDDGTGTDGSTTDGSTSTNRASG